MYEWYVSAGSGAQPVQAADAIYALAPGKVNITKNGFLYIYLNNETQNWSKGLIKLNVRFTFLHLVAQRETDL